MALGFGFNKAKVLAAAEKFVQQGKLQNAIAEYDKIAKQDPKDLTVLNTIGDLYARLGRSDQAAEYFKKVGDAYATDGFVVKAIAIYKKLTKLSPAAPESAVRLAELFTQQGLYNDARAQYTAVADQYLKANDREKATGILKKMLDLDPDNAAMQTKVADLYIKLGRNSEALQIYFTSAQSLYQRGSMDSADEALSKVLGLDPKYAPALLLRGQMAAESGNSQVAIDCFSKLPDLDSHPEALRPLLQAYLKTGNLDEADPIVTKLITGHNDLSGVTSYADALFAAGKLEEAIALYEQHADKLLPGNGQLLLDSLTAAIGKIKEDAPALTSALALLNKAGAKGHTIREVQELLAHALVQSGQLQKAADLYRELAEAEPENPLHEQNYKQVIARMGKDSVSRELSVEEGGQALMVDELEMEPAVLQDYPRETAEAITSALTDSELFTSYNVPEKAIAPLERVLPKAPNDVRLRQRLASLYARAGRFADAANCCTALAEVHSASGFEDQALQFREMAAKYNEQAGGIAASAPPVPVAAPAPVRGAAHVTAGDEPIPFRASSVAEFPVDSPVAPAESVAEVDLSSVTAEELPPPEHAANPVSEVENVSDWEEMLTVEAPAAEEPVSAEPEGTTHFIGEAQTQELVGEETPDEVLEEARFYLSQGMQAETQQTIERLERIAPDHPALSELRSAAASATPAAEAEIASDEQQEGSVAEIELQPEVSAPEEEPAMAEAQAVVEERAAPKAEAPPADVAEPPREEPLVAKRGQEELDAAVAEPVDMGEEISADVLGDFAGEEEVASEAGLDDLVTDEAAPAPAPIVPAEARRPVAVMSAAAQAPAPTTSASPLAGMVSDLEELLDGVVAPAGNSSTSASTPSRVPTPVASAPQQPAAAPKPAAIPSVGSAAAEAREAESMLSDLLEEFKEGIEEPAAESEDPETHYNLGVAFREMGLLDEAIGELQKVCRAVDKGIPFSQPIQAYTWLAQCLVDKGAPQAAIRWYEKALRVSGIGEESRLAVHYDMANAFQAAGNSKAALDNFMEVYGSNIDYRDVADRIRSLRK